MIRSIATAMLAVLATATAAQAESLLVEGTGKVNDDQVVVAPNTLAFTVTLRGTLAVGKDVYRLPDHTKQFHVHKGKTR